MPWVRFGEADHLVEATARSHFLIGAHAQRQADQIAVMDRRYRRAYFPRLRIIDPSTPDPGT